MSDFLLCGCRGVCPLWRVVARAAHQNDEDGPGYRRLKETRSAWLDHVLAHHRALELPDQEAA